MVTPATTSDQSLHLARFGSVGEERPVIIREDVAYDVSAFISDFDASFWTRYSPGHAVGPLIEMLPGCPRIDLEGERMGPPIPRPGKIVCIGLNYVDHVKETGAATPTEPIVFMKASNTVVGPFDDIRIPPGSVKTDYEVELAVIVGTTSRYLPDERAAEEAIGGYAISNDLSEREFQLERGGQWTKGKSFETFNPLGPFLEITTGYPRPMELELKVNGDLRQSSRTDQMLFSPTHLVWYLSQFMVLEPGDVINTGTPAGVALGRSPSHYLSPGDVVEASISGLGAQRNLCTS